ncbi:DNA-processing protein DprA [Paenarthrobacter sp. PH39-S1]|uniref:DNA-processing protein DprA n=1 Tax=Paenarthrobacter sp. PH39-S1 TaxID=3046204 RepID=UPI0024B990BD|nr:DNA-processing protein DprA [Paenarthrobacter sp. PH39-S1]MDJ0357079.1 DNA-processing protein DprA [Paenarthrobacter sp. PH39-S1]
MNTVRNECTSTVGEAGAVVVARAALTRLMEPSDLAGLALIRVVGPVHAVRIATGEVRAGTATEHAVVQMLDEAGARSGWSGLEAAVGRWAPRVKDLAPDRDLAVIRRLGGGLIVPEDDDWPQALADLGLSEPIALWCRSPYRVLPEVCRCVAVVGSRDSTGYGASVTGQIAQGLAERGITVVSGGAYGIDAHAHRAALAGGNGGIATIAVMAGGIDRYYPSGNEDLLRTISQEGAMIAEVPPGTNPTRYRFLQRNRLIAALCAVTVVVEARWRSGALSTAHHADSLSRQVAAVPGSVFSANSAGCHRLLREGSAVCVTDATEVAELAGASGEHLADEPTGTSAEHDGLNVEDLLLLDALPVRQGSAPEKLSAVAGLGIASVLAGLGRLELMGLAERSNGNWKLRKGRQ